MNNKIKKIIFLTITVIAMAFLCAYAKKKYRQGDHDAWKFQT